MDPRPGPRQFEETKNKKFIIAWIVAFVGWMAGSYAVHGTLLQAAYARLPSLFRGEADAQKCFPLMLLAHVMLSGALVWLYASGVKAKAWLPEGVRFGVAIALPAIVPTYIIYCALQLMPSSLVIKQNIFDGVPMAILCVIVAWLFRDEAAG